MYQAPKPFFHMFESDDYVIGLCFADEAEAKDFSGKILYCKNTPIKVGTSEHAAGPKAAAAAKPATTAARPAASAPAVVASPKPASDIASAPADSSKRKQKKSGFFSMFSSKKGSQADFELSKPTGFKHQSGMTADGSARGSTDGAKAEVPQEWRVLFQQAGIKKSELYDPETAEYLMKVVQDALASGTVPGMSTVLAPAAAAPSPTPAVTAARAPPPPPAKPKPQVPAIKPPTASVSPPATPREPTPVSPRSSGTAEDEESEESSSSSEEEEGEQTPVSPRQNEGEVAADAPKKPKKTGTKKKKASGTTSTGTKKKKRPVEIGPDGQPVKPQKKKKKPSTKTASGDGSSPEETVASPRKKPGLKRNASTKEGKANAEIKSKPPATPAKPTNIDSRASDTAGGPPPPPPPPPPPTGGPPAPRRESPASSPPQTTGKSTLPVVPDSRANLMDAIRRGTSLKTVDTSAEPVPDIASLDSSQTKTLADMLASAMAARRSDMQEEHEEQYEETDEWSD